MRGSLSGPRRRKLLNLCFAVHALLSAAIGIAALVTPHLVGVFFGEEVSDHWHFTSSTLNDRIPYPPSLRLSASAQRAGEAWREASG
jgi:hypothetical protein